MHWCTAPYYLAATSRITIDPSLFSPVSPIFMNLTPASEATALPSIPDNVLDKLEKTEFLPDLFGLLQSVETGSLKSQDFDKNAGALRLRLNQVRLLLQQVGGICELVEMREKNIESLKNCNEQRAAFLSDFRERVLAQCQDDG